MSGRWEMKTTTGRILKKPPESTSRRGMYPKLHGNRENEQRRRFNDAMDQRPRKKKKKRPGEGDKTAKSF